MSDSISDEEAERRQEARRALLRRCGPVPKRAKAQRQAEPLTEEQQRLAAGFTFSVRDDRLAEAEAEHRARRRQADAQVAGRDHLWHVLRDREGIDYADEYMGGGDAA